MTGVSTIHHSLRQVDSRSSNIGSIVYIGNGIDRTAVNSHPKLQGKRSRLPAFFPGSPLDESVRLADRRGRPPHSLPDFERTADPRGPAGEKSKRQSRPPPPTP